MEYQNQQVDFKNRSIKNEKKTKGERGFHRLRRGGNYSFSHRR